MSSDSHVFYKKCPLSNHYTRAGSRFPMKARVRYQNRLIDEVILETRAVERLERHVTLLEAALDRLGEVAMIDLHSGNAKRALAVMKRARRVIRHHRE